MLHLLKFQTAYKIFIACKSIYYVNIIDKGVVFSIF
jgi:hypothetical protein